MAGAYDPGRSMTPTVAITCDCGAEGETMPGATWSCRYCARTWAVPRLDPAAAAGLSRISRSYRRTVAGTVALAGALAGLVATVRGHTAGALALAAALTLWATTVWPHLRRRRSRAVASLPTFAAHEA